MNFAALVRLSFELRPQDLEQMSEVKRRILSGLDINNRETQLADCRTYVESRGGTMLEAVYNEQNRSAWKKKRIRQPDGSYIYRVIRPVYEAALSDLRRGQIYTGERLDGIVVADVDRLTRDQRNLEDAIEVVMQYGRPIIDISGSLDLLTDNGRDVARIVVTIKARQSLDTSKRVRRKHEAMAEAGVPAGGNRAFGWLPDKRTKDEVEAALLVAGADDILEGVGLHTICRRWNNLGILSATGKLWQKAVLRNIYLSPRMVGRRVYGPPSVPMEERYARDPEGRPVMGQQDPILELDTWLKVVAKLRDPSRTSKHVHTGGRKYLLSGIICCGYCGRHLMGGFDRRWNKHHYACKPATAGGGCGKVGVTGHHVDELATELVLAYLADRDIEAETGPWPKAEELTKAGAKIAELMGAYDREELAGPYVFPRVREQEQKILTLKGEQAEWLRAHAGPSTTNVAAAWPSLEVEQRREIIGTVIEAVVLRSPAEPGFRSSWAHGVDR